MVVDEPTTKLAALTSGELDFAGIQPAHAAFVQRDPALAVRTIHSCLPMASCSTPGAPPFDELAVRRAVSAAIDRQEIVDGYLYGFGTPASGPVPPGVPGYLPVPQPPASTSPAVGGQATRFELLTVGSGEAALEQMVQARLAAAGFDVVIRQLELSAFLARVYGPERDFDAAVLGIRATSGSATCSRSRRPRGYEAPGDPAAAQRFFADSMPVAFLYHAAGLQGMNRRVLGVGMDLRGELPTRAASGGRAVTAFARAPHRCGSTSPAAGPTSRRTPSREGGVVVAAAMRLFAHAEVGPRERGYLLESEGTRSRRWTYPDLPALAGDASSRCSARA